MDAEIAADTGIDSPQPVFLMGPTACGKTALSVELAEHLNAEIISVDSALVYRGMDIGTAKPTLQERAGIPHHLIDIIDPWDNYSAARFCDDAVALIDAIHARGKRALLTGGTMLYFKALSQGIARLPEASPAIRQTLLEEAECRGWQALHDELAHIDPQAAQRIHPNDPQRLQRALEVYRISGRTLTELQQDTQPRLSIAPIQYALLPQDRAWLHARIEQRFALMVEQGFLQEMQQLFHHPRISEDLPSMRSVGYRQAWQYLASSQQNTDSAWIDKAVAATRQLAKRQMTWLRSMDDVQLIPCDTLTGTQQLARILRMMNE